MRALLTVIQGGKKVVRVVKTAGLTLSLAFVFYIVIWAAIYFIGVERFYDATKYFEGLENFLTRNFTIVSMFRWLVLSVMIIWPNQIFASLGIKGLNTKRFRINLMVLVFLVESVIFGRYLYV